MIWLVEKGSVHSITEHALDALDDAFEMIEVGKVVLDNEELVRKLIALGWDTLEVHDDKGFNGIKWPLKDFANIGGHLH